MKQNLSFLTLFILLTMACSPQKKSATNAPEEGITGNVYKVSGNQMPMKDANTAAPPGIATTIYIYELTNISQVQRVGVSAFYTGIHTKLVSTVASDSTGAFTIGLAPGTYSLFTKYGDRFYANIYDGNNNIAPVLVEKGKLTKVKINMDADAVY
jgi:hypothetical protein